MLSKEVFVTANCILLNGDYSFLCLVDVRRAMKLIFAQKVKVLKYSDHVIKTVESAFEVPAVLLLMRVVRSVFRGKVPFSKKNVLIRDRFTCSYCGIYSKNLTVDHILPKSRGGETNFENCVASCKSCNSLKGSRTPREAGISLRRRPYQPTISEFMRIRLEQSGVYDTLVEFGIF
jgi:5-methylcytosine-specific restriction endonuclease McrA